MGGRKELKCDPGELAFELRRRFIIFPWERERARVAAALVVARRRGSVAVRCVRESARGKNVCFWWSFEIFQVLGKSEYFEWIFNFAWIIKKVSG